MHFKTWHQIAPGSTNLLKVISCLLSYLFNQRIGKCNRCIFRGGGGGGVQAFHSGKNNFERRVGEEGQDTSRHFQGSFGSIPVILPM